MPYRVYLRLVQERLQATYDDDAYPYESAMQFRTDIQLIAQSLEYHKEGDSELAFHTDGRVIELTNCILELNTVLKEKV